MQERRRKRIVYAAFGGSVVASLAWLIALCTDGWVELVLPEPGVYLPSIHNDAVGQTILARKMWSGLWHLCRVEYWNMTTAAANSTSSRSNDNTDTREGIVMT